jgi:hypothetical protein
MRIFLFLTLLLLINFSDSLAGTPRQFCSQVFSCSVDADCKVELNYCSEPVGVNKIIEKHHERYDSNHDDDPLEDPTYCQRKVIMDYKDADYARLKSEQARQTPVHCVNSICKADSERDVRWKTLNARPCTVGYPQ